MLLEELMREPLVRQRVDDLRGRQEHERAQLVAGTCEHAVVEIGERDDEVDVVLAHELAQRRDVTGIADPRDKRMLVGVVERRRKGVQIGREGMGPGALECRHDVDPLSDAREEDAAHRRRGYPALLHSSW